MDRGRADKKTQCAPFVPLWIHELVHDVRRHLQIDSDGEAARRLVLSGYVDTPTINKLGPYFWRAYVRGDTQWPGHQNNEDISRLVKFPFERTERLKMRFKPDEAEAINRVAFALGTKFAHATAALLVLALSDQRVIEKAAPGFVTRNPYSLKRGTYQWGGSIRPSAFRG